MLSRIARAVGGGGVVKLCRVVFLSEGETFSDMRSPAYARLCVYWSNVFVVTSLHAESKLSFQLKEGKTTGAGLVNSLGENSVSGQVVKNFFEERQNRKLMRN